MNTTQTTQIETWNVIKNDSILATAETIKKAWKLVGARNEEQRNELIAHGFKVVKGE
jgi:hypothetical protein